MSHFDDLAELERRQRQAAQLRLLARDYDAESTKLPDIPRALNLRLAATQIRNYATLTERGSISDVDAQDVITRGSGNIRNHKIARIRSLLERDGVSYEMNL